MKAFHSLSDIREDIASGALTVKSRLSHYLEWINVQLKRNVFAETFTAESKDINVYVDSKKIRFSTESDKPLLAFTLIEI